MDDYVRTPLERTVKHGSGERVVYHEQYAVFAAYGHDLFIVEDIHAGIGYGFAVNKARPVVDELFYILCGGFRVDKAAFYAQPAQSHVEQIERAAVNFGV